MGDMPKMIVLSKNLRGESFRLVGANIFRIGRTDDCQITLVDGTISTHHADIIKNSDGSYVVKDNNSTNGTRVNGTKVTEQVITGGDVVQFGGIELLFDDGEEVSREPLSRTAFDITQTAGTIQLSEDLINMNPYGSSVKTGDSKTAKMVFYLIITVLLAAIVVLVTMLFK
ncbi:MAG: FHA domain-containing protein [Lentisphaeria bacterium]